MIRVFVDKSPLESGHAARGVGIYTRSLIEALKGRRDIKLVKRIEEAQVVHYPYFDLFFDTLPLKKEKPTVVTIHDVIPLRYPQYYPPGIKGSLRFIKQKWALQGISAVITVSRTSKKDITRFLNLSVDKINVIYEAPRKIFKPITNRTPPNGASSSLITARKKYSLPSSFVLYVGDVNYNKNLAGLADACKIAKIPLVVVGKQAASKDFDRSHPENKALVEFLEKYGEDKNVLRIGFVPDEDLVKVYNLATVYCQPSFFEGFGLPILEAMACGIPVVSSNTAALKETGGNAATFVNPRSPEDIAKAIKKIIRDVKLQKQLSEKGLKHAKKFSWRRVADETVKIYQQMAG